MGVLVFFLVFCLFMNDDDDDNDNDTLGGRLCFFVLLGFGVGRALGAIGALERQSAPS